LVGAEGAQCLHGALPGLTQRSLEPTVEIRFSEPVGLDKPMARNVMGSLFEPRYPKSDSEV